MLRGVLRCVLMRYVCVAGCGVWRVATLVCCVAQGCGTAFHRLSPPFTAFHRGTAVVQGEAQKIDRIM